MHDDDFMIRHGPCPHGAHKLQATSMSCTSFHVPKFLSYMDIQTLQALELHWSVEEHKLRNFLGNIGMARSMERYAS
jgi:hypothetical protein